MSPLMNAEIMILVFLFGASIGSFLNVVICRLPAGLSIVRPRSRCPHCGHNIVWWENIPIVSFILLRGKCRGCQAPISIQYPLVELLTAALAVACYVRFGPSLAFFFYFAFLAMLVAISFIDIPHQIIPDELSYSGVVLGVAASLVTGKVHIWDSVIGALVGFAIISLIVVGYYVLFKREGMGMGDAKLLAMIGAFLGWQSIPFVLFAGAVQGLVVALAAIGFGWMRKAPPLPDPAEAAEAELKAETTEEVPLRLAAVPFGPFLSLAAMEFLFMGAYYLDLLRALKG